MVEFELAYTTKLLITKHLYFAIPQVFFFISLKFIGLLRF